VIIIGIIAIPVGMACAIASGVKPEYNLGTLTFLSHDVEIAFSPV
jgi:MFS superfamily sulfate permease-like transporter